MDVIGSDSPQTGQYLGERSYYQVLSVAEKKNLEITTETGKNNIFCW